MNKNETFNQENEVGTVTLLIGLLEEVNNLRPYLQELLVYAAACGELLAIELLLGKGALVNGTTANHAPRTALDIALDNDQLAAAALLLACGADVDPSEDESRLQLLQEVFVCAAACGKIDAMKALHEKGISINSTLRTISYDDEGTYSQTALAAAVDHEQYDAVRYLLAHGAHTKGIKWETIDEML